MPISRTRRARRMNRDSERKLHKTLRRRRRIKLMVTTLLGRCSVEIVQDNYLTPDEIETLKPLVRQAQMEELDYYPIPKRIHTKIRRYNHQHPLKGGSSLMDAIDRPFYTSIMPNENYLAYILEQLSHFSATYTI